MCQFGWLLLNPALSGWFLGVWCIFRGLLCNKYSCLEGEVRISKKASSSRKGETRSVEISLLLRFFEIDRERLVLSKLEK